GITFYTVVIAAVGYAAPWRQLTNQKFMTAVAFEQAVGARWVVNIILAAALLSLFKVFNGNLVAASRLLFAMGRRGLLNPRIGMVHPRNQTPALAVLLVGLATAVCMFLGDAILVPITEVGSVASAIGWLAACAGYLRIAQRPTGRLIAFIGACVASAMVLMKVIPGIPGNFHSYEWLALSIWIVLGVALLRRGTEVRLQGAGIN